MSKRSATEKVVDELAQQGQLLIRHNRGLKFRACNLYRANRQFSFWKRTPCVPRPCAADVISQFRNKKRRHNDSFESVPYPSFCGPISTTQKNGNSPVLMAEVHAGTKYIAQNLLLVAQSSSVERWGALGLVCSLWRNMGTQLGRSQLRAGSVGKTYWVSRNVLPREQSAPFGVVEEEVSLAATTCPWSPKSRVFSSLVTVKQVNTQ